MTALEIIGISLGSVIVYAVMVGVTYGIFEAYSDLSKDDDKAAAGFWPVSLPIIIGKILTTWVITYPWRSKLPKAKIHNG